MPTARAGYYALFGLGAAAGLGVGIPLWVVGQGNIDDAATLRAPRVSVGALSSHAYGVSLSAAF